MHLFGELESDSDYRMIHFNYRIRNLIHRVFHPLSSSFSFKNSVFSAYPEKSECSVYPCCWGLLISALGIYGFIVGNFRIPNAVSSGIPCPRGFVIPEEIICGFIIRAGHRPAVNLPADSEIHRDKENTLSGNSKEQKRFRVLSSKP